MSGGEITVDQAHRGYTVSEDDLNIAQDSSITDPVTACLRGDGLKSHNPLYIRNTPDLEGKFCGQAGYGYLSFEKFVLAARQINRKERNPEDFDKILPTGRTTLLVTAILEAGRISLDNNGQIVDLKYNGDGDVESLELRGKGNKNDTRL